MNPNSLCKSSCHLLVNYMLQQFYNSRWTSCICVSSHLHACSSSDVGKLGVNRTAMQIAQWGSRDVWLRIIDLILHGSCFQIQWLQQFPRGESKGILKHYLWNKEIGVSSGETNGWGKSYLCYYCHGCIYILRDQVEL